jgi:hypothetical protein
MASTVIDKAKNAMGEVENKVTQKMKEMSPQFTNHVNLTGQKENVFKQFNPFASADLSSLSDINPKAVQYYTALLLNGGYDVNSEQYKAFMEILKADNLHYLVAKKFDEDRMNFAANLAYWMDDFKKHNSNQDSDPKLSICKSISRLNKKLKENQAAAGFKFNILAEDNSTQDPEKYCKDVRNNEYKISTKDVKYRVKYKGLDGKDRSADIEGEDFDINGNTSSDISAVTKAEKGKQIGGKGKYVGGSSNYYKNALTELVRAEDTKNPSLIKSTLQSIENHPIYSPKFEELFMSDRLIMVVIAFILRNLTLFLIEWGINSSFINTFKSSFNYYILIYSLLFLLIVCAVNNNISSNISLKLLIYYLNTEANGILRIIIHLLVLLLLYPIVVILKNKNPDNLIITYDQKMNIKNALNTITFIIWVMQSIIILRF